jgi:hypothetical protein
MDEMKEIQAEDRAVVVSTAVVAMVTETEELVEMARRLEITNVEQYTAVGSWLKDTKAKKKRFEDERMGMTRPLDASKKRIMDWFARPIALLDEAEKSMKRAMLKYTEEERRRAEEEEARQRRIAKEEADRRAEVLRQEAEKATAEGDEEGAQRLIEKAAEVPISTPMVRAEVPKVRGISVSKVWKYRIVDETLIPRRFLVVDKEALGQYARATKGQDPVAGVEFYSEDAMSASRLGD